MIILRISNILHKCSELEFVDNQLLKLIYADNVILDASGFSKVVENLRSIDG